MYRRLLKQTILIDEGQTGHLDKMGVDRSDILVSLERLAGCRLIKLI